jgi:hypothetical protein
MLAPMKYACLSALLWVANLAAAADGPWPIDAEFWAAPRSGQTVVAEPALRAAVATLLAREPDSRLQIRYPGGETGQLWAQELSAWLIALGIPSTRIETLPGGVRDDQLLLTVVP